MKKHKIFNFGKKSADGMFETNGFDPQTQTAVIRSSICTGEKVAGFKDIKSGRFVEVMLIRSKEDEEEFKRKYKVDKLKVEY